MIHLSVIHVMYFCIEMWMAIPLSNYTFIISLLFTLTSINSVVIHSLRWATKITFIISQF